MASDKRGKLLSELPAQENIAKETPSILMLWKSRC